MELKHGHPEKIGLLVTNLGTPEAPTKAALSRYLKEFLSDPRVIEAPRLIWWFILNGWILRTRPKKSAALYAKIWTPQGAPLLLYTQTLSEKIRAEFAGQGHDIAVAVGMRYGKPAISDALDELRAKNCRRMLVLPLYPQYSAATTGSTFDAVTQTLQGWRLLPELRMVNEYFEAPLYIAALSDSLTEFWRGSARAERLLFSFHGLPKRNRLLGDPYFDMCHATARLVAEKLGLADNDWQVTFQSRFGKEEWLQPYTSETLKELAGKGVKSVDVICPGFPADCLETLEEIAVENRHVFLAAGGSDYSYVPALNAGDTHARALTKICLDRIGDWLR